MMKDIQTGQLTSGTNPSSLCHLYKWHHHPIGRLTWTFRSYGWHCSLLCHRNNPPPNSPAWLMPPSPPPRPQHKPPSSLTWAVATACASSPASLSVPDSLSDLFKSLILLPRMTLSRLLSGGGPSARDTCFVGPFLASRPLLMVSCCFFTQLQSKQLSFHSVLSPRAFSPPGLLFHLLKCVSWQLLVEGLQLLLDSNLSA